MSRKFIFDAKQNHITYRHEDPEQPDKLILEEVDDLEPIIQEAKRLSELEPGKEFRHAAVVPATILRKASREGWLNDPAAWRKWMNDPDNKIFRTWPGDI